MLGASLNEIMHHQACLLLASLLSRPDKSSAPFNPLTGAHAHTLMQCLSCQPNKQSTHNIQRCLLYERPYIFFSLSSDNEIKYNSSWVK